MNLCSDLFWEINKHSYLIMAKVYYQPDKLSYNGELLQIKMFEVKEDICFDKYYNTQALNQIYLRHLKALGILESLVQKTKP